MTLLAIIFIEYVQSHHLCTSVKVPNMVPMYLLLYTYQLADGGKQMMLLRQLSL